MASHSTSVRSGSIAMLPTGLHHHDGSTDVLLSSGTLLESDVLLSRSGYIVVAG